MRKIRYPKVKLVFGRCHVDDLHPEAEKQFDRLPEAMFRTVSFAYRLSKDLAFKFTLLCECRDDVQEIAKAELARLGLLHEAVAIQVKPWMVTRVWKSQEVTNGEVASKGDTDHR